MESTTSLEVEDINIGIASAASKLNDAQIDGAGLTIYSSAGDKTLTWDNSNSRMAFSTDLYAPNISVGSSVTVGTDLTVGGNLNVTGDLTYDEVVGRNLRITGLSTFVGVSTFQNDVYFDNLAYVGTGVTIYGDAGIVSARSFYGDGSNLTNTGATLTAASGTQRFVLTSLTSGTMVDAATDSDLTYNANTDTLGIRNLDVAVDATVNGDLDVDGHTELDNVNVSGVSTFVGVGTFKDDLWVAGDLNVSGDIVYDEVTGRNINITGLSTFTGIGTFASDLYVGGNLEVKGTTTFNGGTLTLGDSDTDNIIFGGEVDSHIIPDDDIVHNLGSNTKRWNDIHAKEFIGGGVNITGIITAGGAAYSGGTSLQQLLVTGIATFQGPITAGSSLGVSGQYMRRTGTGVTWASFPKLRETVRYTATAGQTAFTWSHNVDFLDVFLNGVKLATTEYSNNGTSITLNSGCFAGDEVEFHSWAIASNYGAGGGGGSSTLNGLTDVTLSSPSNGEVLKFNGTAWVNGTDEQGSVGSAGTWASTAGGISTTKNVTVPGFNATGISTLSGWVSLGSTVGAAGSIYIPDNKKLIFGNGEDAYIQVNDADDLYIANTHDSGNIFIRSRDEYRLTNHDGSLPYFSARNGQVDLFYGGSITLSSAGTGATVYNQLNVGTGVTIYNNDAYFAGVITATRFEGAISGVATIAQGLTGSPDITVRNITGVGATFSGNVSIGGTLTYEDVKNIDSVGIITARKDVKIQRNLTVTGISTFTGALNAGVINATTVNANVSGNVTGNVTGNASGTAGGLTGRPSITVSSINVGPTGAGATLGISTVSGSWSAQAGVGHTIDSYDIATDDFKTAEYTLWFNRGSNIQSQKLLVMQDGSTPYSQEFAIMFAPNQIVSIGASMTGTIVNINATPESGITGVTTYKLARNTLL